MSAKPSAKRARVMIEDSEPAVAAPAEEVACPPTAHPEDFAHLQALGSVWAKSPDFRLLPMPKNVHQALGLKPPGVLSATEAAEACLRKPSMHAYTGTEVRDLRSLPDSVFPAFYTGPAHPHMLPEGGARIIVHGKTEEEDDGMTAAGGAGAGAGAGTGAGAGANPANRAMLMPE
jgi:hypothetical protein